MSDDERMDRAERIRKMREGNREETETDGSGGDADAPDDPVDDAVGADQPVDDTGPADQRAAGSAGQQSAAAEPTGQQSAPGSDDGDPATAAQRAAQAAAQMDDSDDDPAATVAPAGPTGVELPDQQFLEEAMATGRGGTAEGAARAAAVEEESSKSEELVRVLEFALGEESYCLDIEYVEEIVKRDSMTRVPNTADYVEGVVDLRGQITTILDPKEMLAIDSADDQSLIIVFDPDIFEEQGAMGWVVDEVRQVAPVTEGEVNDPPIDDDYVEGVVDREDQDQFVIWIEPEDVLAEATAEAGE